MEVIEQLKQETLRIDPAIMELELVKEVVSEIKMSPIEHTQEKLQNIHTRKDE